MSRLAARRCRRRGRQTAEERRRTCPPASCLRGPALEGPLVPSLAFVAKRQVVVVRVPLCQSRLRRLGHTCRPVPYGQLPPVPAGHNSIPSFSGLGRLLTARQVQTGVRRVRNGGL